MSPLTVTSGDCRIPAIGFGTYKLDPGLGTEAVVTALSVGYRHIDAAQLYDNEAEVGAALAASGIPRDELFVTTKVRADRNAPDAFLRSVERSLRDLRLDRLDLLLIHWPAFPHGMAATLGALLEARERGWARFVGVSNFNRPQLREAQAMAGGTLVTNQVEYHPFLDQRAMLAELRRQGMFLTAYSPLARGRIARHPVIAEIAARHGRSPGQITLRWLVQQGDVVAVPKASGAERMRANLAVFDFALTEAEMAAISALGSAALRLVAPADLSPDWDREP
ncbi:MAG: aldo/keto reductase [Geminicoccaceae bacterium]